MDCRKLCFSLIAIAFICLSLTNPVAAKEPATANVGQAPAHASLICETIHPVDPPKGEAPRSCNSYCEEKGTVCTGVQSHQGQPPSCEDEMYKSYGSCRCCTVRP